MTVRRKYRLRLAGPCRHHYGDRVMRFGGAVGQDRVQGAKLRSPETTCRIGLFREPEPALESGLHNLPALRLVGVRFRPSLSHHSSLPSISQRSIVATRAIPSARSGLSGPRLPSISVSPPQRSADRFSLSAWEVRGLQRDGQDVAAFREHSGARGIDQSTVGWSRAGTTSR